MDNDENTLLFFCEPITAFARGIHTYFWNIPVHLHFAIRLQTLKCNNSFQHHSIKFRIRSDISGFKMLVLL